MADVTLDIVGELLRGMFELLWTRPDGLPARDILVSLSDLPILADPESQYSSPGDISTKEKVLRLATLPLVKAGWLVKNDKGRWFITEDGRQACRTFPSPQDLYKEAVRLLEESRESAPLYAIALESAEEKAWELIQTYLQGARRVQFQTLIADLLKAMGYHLAWVAPPEKQHGHIDMVAYVDPLGVKGARILVQIKTKGQAVTLEGLKAFLAILGPEDYGLFISTGGFTNDVTEQIKSDLFRKTTLLNLEGFFDLWIKYYDELDQDARNRFPLKAVYFLYGID
jgi:restriction system protein